MADVTARRDEIEGSKHLIWTRSLPSPIEEVWALVTDPERMERWIGVWEGDPRAGRVTFRMTAEGDDAPAEPYLIEECTPSSRLRVRTDPVDPAGSWSLDVLLTPAADGTLLRFAQRITPDVPIDMVGPGWEYYLDRLEAVLLGRDVEEISWADYEALISDYEQRLDT